jgi:transposase-like protein
VAQESICRGALPVPVADRLNARKGYRPRDWDARVGAIDVAIPKLRSGSYLPDWLLERGRRAEQALVSVLATSYLLGSRCGGRSAWSRP